MKYGLLYFKDTDNIGDDIQTYAAERFLPRVDYLIDRENIEAFVPSKKETVSAIMNAWYIHDKFNFRISPYIRPLFISMFFKDFPYEDGITVGTKYLNENIIASLKKYGPVGTRDLHTKKILDKLGAQNYFSGCMTLTLEPLKDVSKKDYIVAVGLSKKEINYIKKKSGREVIEFVQDIKAGSLSSLSWEERKEKVIDTLRLYQGAHMVITTKLHCTLPNLALGTPVLLLYDFDVFKENKDRLGTYLAYTNNLKRSLFFETEINFDKPKSNPKKYLTLREGLIKTCEEFIKDSKKIDDLPDIDFYKNEVHENRIMRKVIIDELSSLQKKYVKECSVSSSYLDEVKNKEREIDRLNAELTDIKNSRFYKMYEFSKKIRRNRNEK